MPDYREICHRCPCSSAARDAADGYRSAMLSPASATQVIQTDADADITRERDAGFENIFFGAARPLSILDIRRDYDAIIAADAFRPPRLLPAPSPIPDVCARCCLVPHMARLLNTTPTV